MGLHTTIIAHKQVMPQIPLEEADLEPEYSDEENGECPECGSYSWSTRFYGRYSQYAYYTFGNSRYIDYDAMEEEEQYDADEWECENGHLATEIICDKLQSL